MDLTGTSRVGLRALLLATAALLLAGISAPGASAAEGERELDPLLSLIGGCSGAPEPLDPVEDPGCPTTPPAGTHPAEKFAAPSAVTTDFYGNIYVSSFGKILSGTQGRIDIFDPDGNFIYELKSPGSTSVAVDSKGVLYVVAEIESERPILRFVPTVYEPAAGNIAYGSPPVFLPDVESLSIYTGISINQDNDHLFANFGAAGLVEYSSAETGNERLRTTSLPIIGYGVGTAVDASRDLVYASAHDDHIEIFDLNQVVGSPPDEEYKKVGSIEGSATPEGDFVGFLSVAVDEATGNVFVLDGEANRLYEFDEEGTYLATIEHGFAVVYGAEIGVDNGPNSPNGALSDNGRYLFVPSGKTGTGHSFAFEESSFGPPVVNSVRNVGVTEDEAELQAAINPGNLETSYTFEITTQERFAAEGFAGAAVAGSGKLPAGNLDDEASAIATDLDDGTAYRFRVIATNEEGSDEEEGSFSTYPDLQVPSSVCENSALRVGLSASLPDCRAYELVTPPDTNGRSPVGTGKELQFTNRQVSPDGSRIPFKVEGGSLGGSDVTGSYLGDPYLSTRGPEGWGMNPIGPTGAEAQGVIPGGTSPDQGYSFWTAEVGGTATEEGESVSYVRFPDGHSEVLGKGSIGTDNGAIGLLISEGGDHIVFTTENGLEKGIQLEPNAAPSGKPAIYDRTPDGVTHVISLLPGDVPLAVKATYVGSSLDGEGVAFTVGTKLYLRYQNSETYEVGEGVEFAGVVEGGNYIFYVKDERLWRFDAETGERIAFSTGPVTPVNVSEDGTAAYFVSDEALTGETNPLGAAAEFGEENLYLSEEGAIRFVGILTKVDVIGVPGKVTQIEGLGLWVKAANPAPDVGSFGRDPSRSTPDGSTLIFRSRAQLTDYDPEGQPQIYRYDATADELHCLSCNPTGASPTGPATLQSESREGFPLFYYQAWLRNLRPDGRRAFFESPEPLVPSDTDGKLDVYEWEAGGVGSCERSEGCVYLVSSAHSLRDEYLWAISETGNDAFFITSDRVLPRDADETPSIYDARVGGGFPEPISSVCQGEGCRPQLTPPPALPGVQTPVQGSADQFAPPRRCPKGKRKVKKAGKVRCVKKKAKHHKHKASSNRKGGRK
ncbi:MAG TPA: hypothetical protein VFN92_01810 [Solirubrobacterales bacterium]|nr:hypothetical protein [Solirubrobacterales bacterium]